MSPTAIRVGLVVVSDEKETLSTEDLIPADHPIRRIHMVVDAALVELDDVFEAMYADPGGRSVAPETLLKATPVGASAL